MNSHELAMLLLDLPDIPVHFEDDGEAGERSPSWHLVGTPELTEDPHTGPTVLLREADPTPEELEMWERAREAGREAARAQRIEQRRLTIEQLEAEARAEADF